MLLIPSRPAAQSLTCMSAGRSPQLKRSLLVTAARMAARLLLGQARWCLHISHSSTPRAYTSLAGVSLPCTHVGIQLDCLCSTGGHKQGSPVPCRASILRRPSVHH